MRYSISFIILLFCATSLFAQSNTTTLPSKKAETIKDKEPIIICKERGCGSLLLPDSNRHFYILSCLVLTLKVEPFANPSITHQNFSLLGGLPINAFRFQDVNQMANTQAGVLSMDGEIPSILGGRSEGTAYYINGVRVMDNLPIIHTSPSPF